MRRVLFSPSWLLRHLLLFVLVPAFCWLGRWQWGRSTSSTGGVQNLIYALQWWTFALLVVYGWWRMLRDDLRAARLRAAGVVAEPAPVWQAVVRPRRPGPVQDDPDADAELAAYNAYLARLDASTRR